MLGIAQMPHRAKQTTVSKKCYELYIINKSKCQIRMRQILPIAGPQSQPGPRQRWPVASGQMTANISRGGRGVEDLMRALFLYKPAIVAVLILSFTQAGLP